MTFNNILLYTQATASLNAHQRNILQFRKINTETHNWSMFRGYEILKHSVLNAVSLLHTSPQGSCIQGKEESERFEKSKIVNYFKKNSVFQTQIRQLHMKPQRLWQQ